MKKKFKSLFTLLLMLAFSSLFKSQGVGINTSDPKGLLHIKNTTKQLGIVMPIVETAELATATDGTTPVEATVVYDNTQKCLRLKRLTSFTDCLVDKSSVVNIINTSINGGNWIGVNSSDLKSKLFDCTGSLYGTIYTDLADSNFLAGAGYGTYIGTGALATVSPSKRILSKEPVSVAGSAESFMVVDSDGHLWATGTNYNNKFGNNSNVNSTVWIQINTSQIPADEKIIQVKAAFYATIILTDKGNVYAAGNNVYGQTGQGRIDGQVNTFTKIASLKNIISIWGGASLEPLTMFTAIDASGSVFAWGYYNNAGYKGLTAGAVSTPENITTYFAKATANGAKIEKVIINNGLTMALTTDKKLWGATATGTLTPYIGLGNVLSTTSDLRIIFDTSTLDADEQIMDFDTDMLGSMFITNKNVWYTGFNYNNRFGTADANYYTWTKSANVLFDGKIKLTALDLGYYKSVIQTSSVLSEGGGKFISAGYNLYNNISSSSAVNVATYSYSAK